MLFAAEPISRFTEMHPTIKILVRSVAVEMINIRMRAKSTPVHLRRPYVD